MNRQRKRLHSSKRGGGGIRRRDRIRLRITRPKTNSK